MQSTAEDEMSSSNKRKLIEVTLVATIFIMVFPGIIQSSSGAPSIRTPVDGLCDASVGTISRHDYVAHIRRMVQHHLHEFDRIQPSGKSPLGTPRRLI